VTAWSAARIAEALGRPSPTAEQVAVIQAPLGPSVVVAGAGSGKTETMAARVVWLVANGIVRADQVLGLTFTRKAAHELGNRIRRRLSQLHRRAELDQAVTPPMGDTGDATVATYDSYAGRLIAEHALRLGEEPGRRLITEAVAWQLATSAVESYSGEMTEVDAAFATVVDQVLRLHGELAGHLIAPAELAQFINCLLADIRSLPPVERKDGAFADVVHVLRRQQARLQLLPLVDAFRAEKRRRNVLDFADQSSLAGTLAEQFPEIGAAERARFRVVLLDEYQDTSYAQLVMLRALFGGGHPVTAVGDPCQSIYGWRGAHAETLAAFTRHFTSAAVLRPTRQSLTVSFRNRSAILHVANAVARELGADVPTLQASDSSPSQVVVALHETVVDEARDVARRVRVEWDATQAMTGSPPTVAVLVRKRAQIDRIVAALRAQDLPVDVVGVGGLLLVPEVADVVATLQVLADPRRGDALMRLLTGTRWRIGPRDLYALGRWARRRAQARQGSSPDVARAATSQGNLELDTVEEGAIIDALDELPAPPCTEWFSDEGCAQLRALAAELRSLRTRVSQPLPDLVAYVIHTLGVDVEVAAVDGNGRARAHLDAFLDVASEFAQNAETATLPAFVSYLAAAESEERGLEQGQITVSSTAVQVLTIHAAKGLEWDVVCLPGMVEGTFPAASVTAKSWLQDPGLLPFPLRGDRLALPTFDIGRCANQQDVNAAISAFARDCGRFSRIEERRLAYVAVTRARRALFCSGYRWGSGVKPVQPSPFLCEIKAVCEADPRTGEVSIWADPPAVDAENPVTAQPVCAEWPYDPLARRRVHVEAGAQQVQQAMLALRATSGDQTGLVGDRWSRDIDLLLAERARTVGADELVVRLPSHLSVSQLVQLRRDPQALARSIRRPMPAAPNPLARRGTAFHAWLEARWGAPRLVEDDDLPGAADDGGPAGTARATTELATLQRAYLASEWADRTPVEVEAPFELVLDGVLIRGRADAVFQDDDGLEVIDWKTGPPPADPKDLAVKTVQLAAYRLAWARLAGVPVSEVRAAFHHVQEGVTIRPVDVLDEEGLVNLVRSVPVMPESGHGG
jgi:DNA helicase II / ATP-dependent DNA helicase PcrA